MLEPGRRVGKDLGGLAERSLAGGAALDEAERAQRDPEGSRRTPPPGEVELRDRELARLRVAPESVQGERGLRTPGCVRRILDPERVRDAADLAEVRERLL